MDEAIAAYRARRAKRLQARVRLDDEAEENAPNKPQNGGGGGHGNTRLPFGLCARLGIEVGKDWTPRDAWSALEEHGITPGSEFARLKGGGNTTLRTKSGAVYRNLRAEKTGSQYVLRGDYDGEDFSGKPKTYTGAAFHTFLTKDEMLSCLKEYGIDRFKDPDTGKTVNPQKLDLPRTVAKVGERRYTDVVLGTRLEKTGHPLSGRGFSITGKDFTGRKTVLKVFSTIAEAKKYAQDIGCKAEDLRLSPDFKKYASAKAG